MTNVTTMTEAKPKVIMMMGLPGAGKSTTREIRYAGTPVNDADIYKQAHPDYDPKNPEIVHEWSMEQMQRAFYRLLGAGETFVQDGTGTNTDRMLHYMNDAKLAGFDVELCYVKVSLQTAIDRNAARDRSVPERVIREKFAVIEFAWQILSAAADEAVVVEND